MRTEWRTFRDLYLKAAEVVKQRGWSSEGEDDEGCWSSPEAPVTIYGALEVACGWSAAPERKLWAVAGIGDYLTSTGAQPEDYDTMLIGWESRVCRGTEDAVDLLRRVADQATGTYCHHPEDETSSPKEMWEKIRKYYQEHP